MTLILLVGILAIGFLVYPSFWLRFSDPNTACASVPSAPNSGTSNATIRIIFPTNGEDVIGIYGFGFPVSVAVQNSEFDRNGNRSEVRVDGKVIPTKRMENSFVISPADLSTAGISVRGGGMTFA